MKHLILALCILSAGLLHAQVTTTAAVIDTKRSDGTFAAAEVSVLNSSVWGWSSTGTLTRFPLGTGLSINESGQLVATGGSAATWGSITGTLSAQVDLQSALDAKLSTSTAASTYVALAGSYSDPAWITALAWSKISGTPTTLAGYGISDGLTAATAASTYVALAGSYADPAWITALAWSKISGTPTTLAGYGISDGLTAATAASTYVALAGSYADPAWITSLAWSKISGAPSLVTTFLGLTDTPASYTGQAGKVVAVKGDASGLEFIAPGGTGTVTSVAIAGTDGIEVDSGSPITAAGTITLGLNAATLKTSLDLSGTNSGDVTLAGSLDYLTLAGQVITLGAIDLGTDTTGSLAWGSVSKTGSSLADLATRSAGDLTSGTLDAARLPAPTTTALGGVKRNAGTGGQFVNGIASDGSLTYDTPAGGGSSGAKHVILSSDVTITDNTTLQDITGLSFSVSANTSYGFRVDAVVVTSANGTGYELGLNGPTSPTFWVAESRLGNGTAGANNPGMGNSLLGYGAIGANASGSTAGTNCFAQGSFECGSTAGTVQFRTKVETAVTGSVIFKAGSRVTYWETSAP